MSQPSRLPGSFSRSLPVTNRFGPGPYYSHSKGKSGRGWDFPLYKTVFYGGLAAAIWYGNEVFSLLVMDSNLWEFRSSVPKIHFFQYFYSFWRLWINFSAVAVLLLAAPLRLFENPLLWLILRVRSGNFEVLLFCQSNSLQNLHFCKMNGFFFVFLPSFSYPLLGFCLVWFLSTIVRSNVPSGSLRCDFGLPPDYQKPFCIKKDY